MFCTWRATVCSLTHELGGDLAVRPAGCDQTKHLELARAEPVGRPERRRERVDAREVWLGPQLLEAGARGVELEAAASSIAERAAQARADEHAVRADSYGAPISSQSCHARRSETAPPRASPPASSTAPARARPIARSIALPLLAAISSSSTEASRASPTSFDREHDLHPRRKHPRPRHWLRRLVGPDGWPPPRPVPLASRRSARPGCGSRPYYSRRRTPPRPNELPLQAKELALLIERLPGRGAIHRRLAAFARQPRLTVRPATHRGAA